MSIRNNTATARDKIALIRRGQVQCAVHRLPWQSAQQILEPADELTRCLAASFGQPIPLADPKRKVRGAVDLVLHLDVLAKLEREEFEVTAAENRIELRARTVPAMFHAVYWFLEQAIGARWLWPGKLGEVIPRHRDCSFPAGHWRESPDFAWRSVGTQGSFYEAVDYLSTLHGVHGLPRSYLDEFALWCRRNRFGGLNIADGHRWAEIAPADKFGAKHPDWYALVDGKRDNVYFNGKHHNQPCLANPAVTDRMVEYVTAYLEANPHLDGYSIALNDADLPCQCEKCLALDPPEEQELNAAGNATFHQAVTEQKTAAAQRSITDRVFWQANQVAERVLARFPGKMLLIHLYGHYREPARREKLHPGIIGQYCVLGYSFWDDAVREAQTNLIQRMAGCVPSLGIYEYYSNGAWPDTHRLFPELVESTIRAYHAAGARYFATQPSFGFAVGGLTYYIASRCLWDVETRSAEVVNDVCKSGFGPAAKHIRRYFDAFARRWRETRSARALPAAPSGMLSVGLMYSDEFLSAREQELAAAHRAARTDRTIRARIAFLRSGLEYTRRYAVACRATIALYDAAKLDDQRLPALPSERIAATRCRQSARAAQRAWDSYWSFVRRHSGQYVFCDFWAHYRPGLYGERAPLLARVRALAGK
jgi:hypothetical protein